MEGERGMGREKGGKKRGKKGGRKEGREGGGKEEKKIREAHKQD